MKLVEIGDEFKTGEKALVHGIYGFIRHMDPDPSCVPTPEERQIELGKDEVFPAHKHCDKGVIWKLVSLNNLD